MNGCRTGCDENNRWDTDRCGVSGTPVYQQREMVYDASWRLLEEHVGAIDDPSDSEPDPLQVYQQFWGIRYIDDAVSRRGKAAEDEVFENEKNQWWYVTDAQFSVAALLDPVGVLVERVNYDPYGKATHIRPAPPSPP